jgi:ABC-type sugar transport system substrate-binding protein
MMLASQPLTDDQRSIFNKCMGSDDCDTGQGGYTLAIVDDQVNTFYSMSRAETVAMAIKSGAVKRILHFATDMEVQKYLADWRSAIGQKSDLILSIYGGLGNQAGQVIQEAKAKGIPVVNGCCPISPDVTKLLTVNVNASICDMWLKNGGGEQIASFLKDKGDTDPTYALFTGPAGNAFAGVWQPCVKEAMDKAGMKLVYEGNTEWTPQGTVKAANALMASGEKPDVLVYDTYAEDFIHAYEDAGEKDIPTFVLTASSTVGTAKAYQYAKDQGFNIDAFVAPAIVWLQDVGLQTEIEIKDGKDPSGDTITYPMTLTNLADVIDGIDLTVNEAAFVGSTLEAEDQNESLKH